MIILHKVKSLTWLWTTLATFQVIVLKLPEIFKVIEITIVQVIGSFEDVNCFNNLNFIKSKLQNQLTTHLPLIVKMYCSTIPYEHKESKTYRTFIFFHIAMTSTYRKSSLRVQFSHKLSCCLDFLFVIGIVRICIVCNVCVGFEFCYSPNFHMGTLFIVCKTSNKNLCDIIFFMYQKMISIWNYYEKN